MALHQNKLSSFQGFISDAASLEFGSTTGFQTLRAQLLGKKLGIGTAVQLSAVTTDTGGIENYTLPVLDQTTGNTILTTAIQCVTTPTSCVFNGMVVQPCVTTVSRSCTITDIRY